MKVTAYFTSVIGAAILSGAASLLSPQSWRKYVGMVTGLVILCTIIAPLSKIDAADIFDALNDNISQAELERGETLRIDMIKAELTQRINSDIEKRMLDEFGVQIRADAEVGVNSDGKITGVNAIAIEGRLSSAAEKRLCEVYGVEKISVKGHG